MNLAPQSYLKISIDKFVPDLDKVANINLAELASSALENRPDVKASVLEEKYNNRKYKYELAQRTPDVLYWLVMTEVGIS